jgi:hypothetical protein
MKRRILVLFAGAVLLTGSSQVAAHHSFSATYDSSHRVELEGVVKEFVWRNPHSFLRIDVTDKDGTTKTWALEWGSISQLSKYEMTRTSLKPGDKIIVGGEPARDQSSPRLLLQTLKRPSDGFSWQGRVE